MESFCFKLVIW